MLARRTVVVGIGLLASAFGLAQPSSGQTLGAISGIVVSAVTKTPLAGCRVALSAANGEELQVASSDRRGQFLFDQLPEGRYRLAATRDYFATARFGQKQWNQGGQIIELGPGAGFSAEIVLHRLGVITGTVLDENGAGIPEMRVRALRTGAQGQPGRRAAEGVSDDRGVFRLPGLKPGFYYVVTAAQEVFYGTGLLPTFHPSSLHHKESRPVEAQIDQESADIGIQPIAGRLARISGKVAVPPGRSGGRVTLQGEDEARDTGVDPSGQFAFANLVPGRYVLTATADGMNPLQAKLAAYQPVEIDRDMEGLTLGLSPAPEVRVRLIDEKGAPVADPQVRLLLSRTEPGGATAQFGISVEVERRETPGLLAATGLTPGQWRFFVIVPLAQVVESIDLEGKDGLAGFALMPGQRAQATIRLARAGLVRGQVSDAEGKPAPGVPVLCHPLDPQNRYRIGAPRSWRTDNQGEYRCLGLPEGQYLVLATTEDEFNPEGRLEELRERIEPVKVTASTEIRHNLRVLE